MFSNLKIGLLSSNHSFQVAACYVCEEGSGVNVLIGAVNPLASSSDQRSYPLFKLSYILLCVDLNGNSDVLWQFLALEYLQH